MTPEERKLEKITKLLELADKDYASADEVAAIISEIVSIIRSNKEEWSQLIEKLTTEVSNKIEELTITGKENYLKSEELVNKSNQSTLSEIKALTRQLNDEISRVTRLIPKEANLAPLERRINEVESKIPVIPPSKDKEIAVIVEDVKFLKESDDNLIKKIDEVANIAKANANALPITTTHIYKNGELVGRAKNINFRGDDPNVSISGDTANVDLSGGTGTGTVESVTGLNTDNTDPNNPIVQISVDGSTITGQGTPEDPLVASTGGFSGTEGSVTFIGADTFLAENNDNYFFDNDAIQLRVGTVDDVYSGASTDPLLVSQEIDDYHAITIRNRSNGTSASSDLVVSNDLDDGEDTGVYGNFGIVSSTYTRGGAELVQPNDTYLEAFGGDLLIQAHDAGKTIKFTTGGDSITDLRAEISDSLTQFYANYDTDITPTFTGGNWTGTNGWSVSGGELVRVNDASDGTIQPATPLTIGIGSPYKVTITTSAVSGTVTYTLGGVAGSAIAGATTENFITALTTDNFIITGLAGSTATITAITILPLIDDTGDVFIEGNLTVGSTIKTTSGQDVFNIDGDGVVTFPNHLPFGPSGVSPTQDYHLVTKLYADTLFSSGARFVDDVRAGTTTALPACTYDNGTSGVLASLTGNANGALSAQDGVTLTIDQMLLVKNQVNQAHNGVYVLTQPGDGSNPFILTRLGTYDTTAEIVTGTFFTVLSGDTLALSQWSMNNDATITVGTTDITFAQLSAPLTYTGGDGIDITSTTISVELASTPGLEFNAGALRVYTDETTIERSAGGIRVKDGGITASKLVGGGVPEAPDSGAIDGSNRVFVFTQTPLYINLNGMNYYEDNGYTLSGLTVTFDVVLTPPTGSIIRNHYV